MKGNRIRLYVSGLLATTLLSIGFLSSCTEADVAGDNTSGQQHPGDIETTFLLEVAVSETPVTRSITFTAHGSTETDTLAVGAPDTLQTRSAVSLPDAQEKKVAGLWIGQYTSDGVELLSNQYIESVTGTNITVKLKKSNSCYVRFVANAGDLGPVPSRSDLEGKKIPYASAADGRPQSNLLVMTGTWTGKITGDKNQPPVSNVTLTRLAAKITFTYKINGTGFSFTPASVRLKNVPDRSQIGTLTTQLAPDAVVYRDYTGTVSATGATMYWYLPENMAGSGSNTSNSEKEKTGQGVTNATYVELSGDAMQNGVEYKDVVFRFYPGSNGNDYNIRRNDHFIMNVDMKGLDISDKRITVGRIPSITVSPEGNLPAAAGGTREVLVTSRAGVVWNFTLPEWLSATVDGQTTPAGSVFTYQGPCKVTFTTTKVNQSTQPRSQTFAIKLDEKGTTGSFALTQDPASFFVTQGTLELSTYQATSDKVGIQGTSGLAWTITPSETTNGITPVLPAADGTMLELRFDATANPMSNRTATFTISVPDGNLPPVTVVVKQPADPVVVIDQRILELYAVQMKTAKSNGNFVGYPPFDREGTDYHPGISSGDITLSDPPSMNNKSYSIRVESLNEAPPYKNYAEVTDYCSRLREGGFNTWRIPTQIELVAMWDKCKGENMDATDDEYASTTLGAKFKTINSGDVDYTWSCSTITFETNYKSKLSFKSGLFTSYNMGTSGYIRCVRDLP